ncbi:DUF1127 domain-containing protein [Rhodobacteraceae bacterium]|nr:DUF1127 domain-containing protein [Paracoccaceae bacterium]
MLQYLNKVFKKVQIAQERRAAYFMLQHLSDKQLKDMGVTRGEIRQKVYEL